MTKIMFKKLFTQEVLNKGCITIDKDGSLKFIVTQINDENFKDINPQLKQQLKDEGKYNSWIAFITFSNESAPYGTQSLPIFGNSQRYVTKWFTNTAEEAIKQCLSDRQMELLKRAYNYEPNVN